MNMWLAILHGDTDGDTVTEALGRCVGGRGEARRHGRRHRAPIASELRPGWSENQPEHNNDRWLILLPRHATRPPYELDILCLGNLIHLAFIQPPRGTEAPDDKFEDVLQYPSTFPQSHRGLRIVMSFIATFKPSVLQKNSDGATNLRPSACRNTWRGPTSHAHFASDAHGVQVGRSTQEFWITKPRTSARNSTSQDPSADASSFAPTARRVEWASAVRERRTSRQHRPWRGRV